MVLLLSIPLAATVELSENLWNGISVAIILSKAPIETVAAVLGEVVADEGAGMNVLSAFACEVHLSEEAQNEDKKDAEIHR